MSFVRVAVLPLLLMVTLSTTAEEDNFSEPSLVLGQAIQFLEQCGANGLITCLKERALRYLDTSSGNLEIAEGITLREINQEAKPRLNTSSLILPEEPSARAIAIDSLLMDRVAKFLSSRMLEFKMPKSTVAELRNLAGEEGRRKRRKMLLPLLLLLKLKAVALLPLALGAIGLISFKALAIGKLAMIIAGLVIIKKLLENKQPSQTYEVVAHPHYTHSHLTSVADEHHGHYRRALQEDLQNVPYSAYVQQQL